jgi:hypothetical protein
VDDDDLEGWTPKKQIVYSDDELIRHLRLVAGRATEPTENWWTFYSSLPKPERDRLAAEAARPTR